MAAIFRDMIIVWREASTFELTLLFHRHNQMKCSRFFVFFCNVEMKCLHSFSCDSLKKMNVFRKNFDEASMNTVQIQEIRFSCRNTLITTVNNKHNQKHRQHFPLKFDCLIIYPFLCNINISKLFCFSHFCVNKFVVFIPFSDSIPLFWMAL